MDVGLHVHVMPVGIRPTVEQLRTRLARLGIIPADSPAFSAPVAPRVQALVCLRIASAQEPEIVDGHHATSVVKDRTQS
jgi:hypothetical protein